ncbi:MAG TPA: hypothetical protein VKZ55_01790 [Microthrixaceae bacterium]|jgi:hypothetical protein|nr:hypothetical protein [Microthrixaceae bacterium]
MSSTTPDPEILRPAAIGAVAGLVVVTLLVTIGGTMMGIEPGGALGLGVFAGMWAGAGFGFMLGATVPLARHLDRVAHDREAARSTASVDAELGTQAA